MADSSAKIAKDRLLVEHLSALWPEEQWRDMPGYGGCYQISSHGRIRSLYKGGKVLKPKRQARIVMGW
jgi:hypothetical protein